MRIWRLENISTLARGALSLLLLSAVSCASKNADRAPRFQTSDADRISAGLQRLGASPKRGNCFGRRVTEKLDPDAAAEAAAIVESAGSKSEMRDGVLSASKPVRRAFVGANMRCALT